MPSFFEKLKNSMGVEEEYEEEEVEESQPKQKKTLSKIKNTKNEDNEEQKIPVKTSSKEAATPTKEEAPDSDVGHRRFLHGPRDPEAQHGLRSHGR